MLESNECVLFCSCFVILCQMLQMENCSQSASQKVTTCCRTQKNKYTLVSKDQCAAHSFIFVIQNIRKHCGAFCDRAQRTKSERAFSVTEPVSEVYSVHLSVCSPPPPPPKNVVAKSISGTFESIRCA